MMEVDVDLPGGHTTYPRKRSREATPESPMSQKNYYKRNLVRKFLPVRLNRAVKLILFISSFLFLLAILFGRGETILGLLKFEFWRALSLQSQAAGPFPNIKSTHSLVAKHVTEAKWKKLGGISTKTSGFTLAKVSCHIIHASEDREAVFSFMVCTD